MKPPAAPLRIIGISGKKGSGKDTVARLLTRHMYTPLNHEIVTYGFADHLKWIAMTTWGLTFDQLYNDRQKEVVDPCWGLTPRVILQRLGTDVAREIHADTWVRRLTTAVQQDHAERNRLDASHLGPRLEIHPPNRRADRFGSLPIWGNHPVWIVPDVRFPNEWAALRALGAPIIRVTAEERLPPTDGHLSETALDTPPDAPDIVLDNNGSIAALIEQLIELLPKIHQLVTPDLFHPPPSGTP